VEQAWRQAQAVIPPRPTAHFAYPKSHDREGVRKLNPDRVQQGLVLISSNWKDDEWKPGLKLINKKGKVLHEWRINPTKLSPKISTPKNFAGPGAVHLFENGDILTPLGKEELARLDACGNIVWRLPLWAHHSIHQAEDGSLWVLGKEKNENTSHSGIQRFDEVEEDIIVHLSLDGKIKKKISVLDILWKNDLHRYIFKMSEDGVRPTDLTHANDVEPLPVDMADEYPKLDVGDVAISLRRPDLVVVFDPKSRKVKWYKQDELIGQHDPDFIGGGWIGVFDNNTDGTKRGKALGGSRVVAFNVNDGSEKVLFQSKGPDTFYTPFGGWWQTLKNENMLLVESKAGRVVEVDQNGDIVWEWIHESYREDFVPQVSYAKQHQITTTQIGSWPCSSVDSATTSTHSK
jgi:hypothetical protein